MARGRPRKYQTADAAEEARRFRQRARLQQRSHDIPLAQVGSALQLPGQMVWEVPSFQSLAGAVATPDQSAQLHEILPFTEVEPSQDVFAPDESEVEDHPVPEQQDVDATSQDSVSMEMSEPSTPRLGSRSSPIPSIASSRLHQIRHRREASRRSRRSHTQPSTRTSLRSSTAEPTLAEPLPATPLAHFLATQYLSDDPAQTLLELTRHAPGAQDPLLETLASRQNQADEVPPPNHSMGLQAGLEHIRSHFAADRQLPDMISQRSIEKPEINYTPAELQYLFTGYTCEDDQDLRPRIDPLVDTVGDYTVTSEFDIDSLVIVSQHLGLFRQGILWYPSQMPMGALTTGMHLKSMAVEYHDNHGHLHQRRVPMHHIPNYCFARLPGADGFTVHWLFPRLYQSSTFTVAEKEGQRLTDRQFQHWTDRILLPSLKECLPASRRQHHPASFKHAQANARAIFTETRTTAVTAAAHHQNLQYEIPGIYLPAIQAAIARRTEEAGNHLFRGSYMVVVGKGLKLQPWKTASWASTMDYFFSWFTSRFDPEHFSEDAVHVDIGKETMPPPSQSLLWREDFLRLFASCLQTCVPESSTLKPTIYPWSFVRGVGSATLEMPLQSPLRTQGLSYVQHYASLKEITAAGDTYLFSNTGFSNLTLSPEVLATFQQIGGAISVRPEVLIRAYIACKLRGHYGLWASVDESFGSRWESRVTLRLLRQIDQCARRLTPRVSRFQQPAQCAWVAHPTETLVEWTRYHLNKFCFGFETIYGRCQEKPYIAWEHTQLMILMLKCISCFAGVLIPGTYPQLWLDQYQPRSSRQMVSLQHQPRQGLGIGTNMAACGYGWLSDKIDWQNLVLRPEVSGQFRVQKVSILETFRAQYQRLRNHMDDYVLVASSVSLLTRWKDSRLHVAFILRLLRAICLRAFLRDVSQILQPYIRSSEWAGVAKGRLGLSVDTLDRILKHRRATSRLMVVPHQKIRNFHGLFQYLWGERDPFSRGAWQRLPYRMLYRFCGQILTDVLGVEFYHVWQQQFSKHVRINCWLLPYPTNKSLVSHEREDDGRVQFRWWSNYNYKVAQFHGDDPDQVILCRQWTRWPPGRWSVTPEEDIMRGLPRPDIQLAFLRPGEVVQQLQNIDDQMDEQTSEVETGDDEDGLDPEGIRNGLGHRELFPAELDSAATYEPIFDAFDPDDSELSEYEDRRRLRREEKQHDQREAQLGLLRRSLRLEQQAFHKSIPRNHARSDQAAEDDDSDDGIVVPSQGEIERVMRRYDERLARVSEAESAHARAASQLVERCDFSLRQARARRQQREREQRALDARIQAEAEQRRRVREQAVAERSQQVQEQERASARRLREARRANAVRQERRQRRLQGLWLSCARSQTQHPLQGRRVLGELSMVEYPSLEAASLGYNGPTGS